MSDRDSRSAILAAIESGELSAEDGIARLAGLASSAEVALDVEAEMAHSPLEGDRESKPEGMVSSAKAVPSAPASPASPAGAAMPLNPTVPPVPPVPPVPAMPAVSVRAEPSAGSIPVRQGSPKAAAGHSGARWLRLRVRDRETGAERVKLNLPLSLVDAGLSMFSRLDPEGDWPRWRERFDSGEGFTLLEVDEPGGERVEITVD
jgi:hypothetical protein